MPPQIEQLLQEFPADQRQLRFSFDRRAGGYVGRAMLTLPTGHLVAQTDAPISDYGAVVDQVVDRLATEVRQHRQQLLGGNGATSGGGRLGRRRSRRERDFAASASRLAAARRQEDRDGFFDLMRPLLRQLRSHARRELVLAQLEGQVPPGELTVGDLLDEVLVRAWDRWPERPRGGPLDQWLVRLLHEALDEWGFRPPDEEPRRTGKRAVHGTAAAAAAPPAGPPLSIYERLRDDDPHAEEADAPAPEINPDSPFAAENGWAVENNPYWPFVDSLTRDDVLPAEGAAAPAAAPAEPWRALAAEEERRLILDELRKFPRDQRRAFALHALEEWSVDEIAEAQGRPPERVRADIDAVRRALRERLKRQEA